MSNLPMPRFRFESDVLVPQTFEVRRFEGTEEISRPYRFDIELVSQDPALELDAVVGAPACLVLPREDGERRINGIVASVVQGAECQPGRFVYRATLVPRLWMLSQSRRSRIYQGKTIPDIVAEQLRDLGEDMPAAACGDDASGMVAFRLQHSYPASEYRVQYDETDLDFVSRLLEHEGISYFFEQGERCERLVLTDHNDGFSSCASGLDIPYAPAQDGNGSVRSLLCERRSVPRRLVLHDQNYRMPQVPLQAESDVDAAGVGLIAEHGTHFATPEEGERLSAVRAQEIGCRRQMFTGEGDHGGFCAGHRYRLAAHFRDDFNQDYLITRLRHTGDATGAGADYRNEFDSVPLAVTWRPSRVTAKPKLHGIMNAHVDSNGPGERAQMDDQGRYKLAMPFDLDGAREGEGSCFIRMAQPFGGKDEGMHFPLAKGTEVIWTCIDGDPDRPIITSTVPNPMQRSVVTSDNADRNILRTAGGITMEFSNGVSPAGGRASLAPDGAEPWEPLADVRRPGTGNLQLLRQRQFQPDDGFDTAEENTSAKWFKVHVPDHAVGDESAGLDAQEKASYLRLGSYDAGNPIELGWFTNNPARLHLNTTSKSPEPLTGVFDYTAWNRTTISMHNNEQYVHGKNRINIGGGGLGLWDAGYAFENYFRKVGSMGSIDLYRHTTMDHSSSDSYSFGDNESFFGGFTFSGFAGLNTGVTVGGSLNVGVSGDVSAGYAFSVDAKYGANVDLTAESQKTQDAQEHDIIGGRSIQIRIKGGPETAADKAAARTAKIAGRAYTALAAGVVGVVAAGATVGLKYGLGQGSEDEASTWGSSAGFSLATVSWAAMLIYGGIKNKAVDKFAKVSPSSIDLSQTDIKLAVGAPPGGVSSLALSSSIEIKSNSIKLVSGGLSGSSLEISPAGIVMKTGNGATKVFVEPAQFNASGPQCTVSAKAKTLIKGNGGVTIKGIGAGNF